VNRVPRRLWFVLLLLLPMGGACQPLVGLVFDVVLPSGAADSAVILIEARGTNSNGVAVEPDRVNVSRTERGFVVEVAYYEPGVDVAPVVWADVDGDGARGPGDLAAEMREVHLDGAGCDSMTTLGTPVRLAPIPAAG